MKKAIAMKCSQKDWDSIKGKLEGKYKHIDSFDKCKYLTNIFTGENNCISNISKTDKFGIRLCEEIHETFNAKIFLNACGIDCDVYEITKEQLKSLIEAAVCNIKDYVTNNDGFIDDWMKDEFPEAFKKELEVGKWYKSIKSNCIAFIEEVYNEDFKGYGFDNYKEWVNSQKEWTAYFENWQEATPQEVESALFCEAKKRGYKNENYCIGFRFNQKCILRKGQKQCFENNTLTYMGCDIFQNGQWAEIIETITIQEAEKLLNKKIV